MDELEKIKEELLANFMDGDSWVEANASTFTKHGALDIALYFYAAGKTAGRNEAVDLLEKHASLQDVISNYPVKIYGVTSVQFEAARNPSAI